MGKKRTRKAYQSNGQRSNVASSTSKLVRRETNAIDKQLNILRAWRSGKNPWVTVPGPTTRERFVRVRANDYYGDPKKSSYGIFRGKTDE